MSEDIPNKDLQYMKDSIAVPAFDDIWDESPSLDQNDFQMALDKGLDAEVPGSDFVHQTTPGGPNRPGGHYGESYLTLQAYYRKALELYLLETLELNLFYEELEQTKLAFAKAPSEDQSSFARYSNYTFDYIYLRNRIYIEHLAAEDIELLKTLQQTNNSIISSEALNLVKRTYPDVIAQYNSSGNPYGLGARVGISGAGLAVEANALLIAVDNPTAYTAQGDYAEGEPANQIARKDYLLERLPVVRTNMMAKLDIPITFIITHGKYIDYVIDQAIQP